MDCQKSILFRAAPATVVNDVTGLTSFQYFVFPLGNPYLGVQRHYARDDYNMGTKKKSAEYCHIGESIRNFLRGPNDDLVFFTRKPYFNLSFVAKN